MNLITEIKGRNETAQGAAQELGRGLMRGNREELKLGYSWENAAITAGEMMDLAKLDKLELQVHLLGFAAGMTRSDLPLAEDQLTKLGEVSIRFRESYEDGIRRGNAEDITQTLPAGIESAETTMGRQHTEATTMQTCGCGATTKSDCAAAVEGYFTSLGQRSDGELHSLARDDGCEAARVMLYERSQREEE